MGRKKIDQRDQRKGVESMPSKSKKEKKKLVIVESPTKTKSLSKFLGVGYEITSSKGHLIDLPKSRMGIDIENNFEPYYMTIRGKGKTLAELRRAAKKSLEVLLATDPDREGEAISWHLARVLSEQNPNIKRVEFNEITKEAVLHAIQNPREIDIERVNSQQARRLLDRLVGYSISPVLQEKFGSKRFSAGRVQSVALRIICDREAEIEKFKPKEYWEFYSFWNDSAKKESDGEIPFKLAQINGGKVEIDHQEMATDIEKEIKKTDFFLSLRKESEKNIKPAAPYITSKLQQEASTRLNFRARKTMSVAQSLYEGVPIDSTGPTGLITYMRTDSTRISEAGLSMCRDYIKTNYPPAYLSEKPNVYGKGKQSQDAHEAIRPTDVSLTPESIRSHLSTEQFKLYQLIWQRFVASQMTPAVDLLTTLEIIPRQTGSAPVDAPAEKKPRFLFRYSASKQKFAGFRIVMPKEKGAKPKLPSFKEGAAVSLLRLEKEQKFTSPPPRYTEASLIKVMEESGIGRPATYAPTISTLDKRAYVERKGRQLNPTTLGRVVNDMLVEYFPDIVDLSFTASMEEKLDSIADGEYGWQTMLHDFFPPFKATVENASNYMESKVDLIRIPINKKCPECEKGMLFKKLGKNGFFIGCDLFREGCRYAESISLGKCPQCGGDIFRKKSKKGRNFYGCSNYSTQNCEFIMSDKPASKDCPKCGSIMGERVRKAGIKLTCQNKECNFVLEEVTQETASVS